MRITEYDGRNTTPRVPPDARRWLRGAVPVLYPSTVPQVGLVMGSEVGDRWRQLRSELERQAVDSKSAQTVVVELAREYQMLDEDDRADVDEILRTWVLSDVEAERFDALAVIGSNRIASAIPALRQLCARLEESDAPGAPYEWAKVNRILGQLGDAQRPPSRAG